jgi:hypothetical protein
MLCVRFFLNKMIGTIRKHAKWLLWLIAGATIASLVIFMGSGPVRSGGGSEASTNIVSGEIYGHKVTPELYDQMSKEVDLYYLFNYGEWPGQDPSVTQDRLLQDTYVRMMLILKAKELGMHVSEEQAEQAAVNYLRSPALQRALGMHNQNIPFNSFVQQVLEPQGLSAIDFENFVRNDLAVEQLQQTFGLSGQLITPDEAKNEYIQENQEFSAEIVFFSASNDLNEVSVTPEEVGDFYTNYMADYRLPDRVQVSYVLFPSTNYLAEAAREFGKTNLDLQVNGTYEKYGMQAAPDAKTPAEAKEEIRNVFLRHQALQDASTQANEFASSVYNIQPVSPNNLNTVARQKGLTVENPAPFSSDYGPQEFDAPPAFTQTAFRLNSDSPLSEPIAGPNGIYVIAFHNLLLSEIPPLDQIRARVTHDLRLGEAKMLALRAGTNFLRALPPQMAAGKSFAAVAFAAGLNPLVLPPFSLSTQELPELEDHATMNQIKGSVITTPVGAYSGFRETDDGGFVLFVSTRLPVDDSKMATDLPGFTSELRERRQQAAFNDWLQHEASRELRNTPLGKRMGVR